MPTLKPVDVDDSDVEVDEESIEESANDNNMKPSRGSPVKPQGNNSKATTATAAKATTSEATETSPESPNDARQNVVSGQKRQSVTPTPEPTTKKKQKPNQKTIMSFFQRRPLPSSTTIAKDKQPRQQEIKEVLQRKDKSKPNLSPSLQVVQTPTQETPAKPLDNNSGGTSFPSRLFANSDLKLSDKKKETSKLSNGTTKLESYKGKPLFQDKKMNSSTKKSKAKAKEDVSSHRNNTSTDKPNESQPDISKPRANASKTSGTKNGVNASSKSPTFQKYSDVAVVDLTTTKEPPKKEAKSKVENFAKTSTNNNAQPTSDPAPVQKELTPELKVLLQKKEDMIAQYSQKAEALFERGRKGLVEEKYDLPTAPDNLDMLQDDTPDDEFPEIVVKLLASIIEGSSKTLSKLVKEANSYLSFHKKLTSESITARIKLIAKRKTFLQVGSAAGVDPFEDEHNDRIWRWEVITLELLPDSILPAVKKSRAARKKLTAHHTASIRLIKSLEAATQLIKETNTPQTKLDAAISKVNQDEEKVLKFEREAEKIRLQHEAKRKKEEERIRKEKEKKMAEEEKNKEKERKKQEAEQKKQEAEQAREEAKLQKEKERQEKEEQKQRETKQKEEMLNKQKECLRSFFAPAPKPKTAKKTQNISVSTQQSSKQNGHQSNNFEFDVNQFRRCIDSQHDHKPVFKTLSSKAVASRKHKTKNVPVSVYVTVLPDDPFSMQQPFAEQRTIQIPNKYKYLSFHEDCRPPYHGTWSKKSSIITGKTPFAKDTKFLDYDVDSEAEWEEGDDEIGEDVDDDAKNQEEEMEDEEGDIRNYNYQDGFCVADDEYLAQDENIDEETKLLYKQKLQQLGGNDNEPGIRGDINHVCIVAPSPGGIPVSSSTVKDKYRLVEGFDEQSGLDLLTRHNVIVIRDLDRVLDAFPPMLVEEKDPPAKKATDSQDYEKNEMQILARFLHHNTSNSKEKIIEELKNANPTMFQSRAKAMRKLDSIAIKKRPHSKPGVYWEVKRDVLEELDLSDLVSKQFEPPPAPKPAPEAPKDSSNKKAPQKKKQTKKRKSSNVASANADPNKKQKVVKQQTGKDSTKTTTKSDTPTKKSALSMSKSAGLMAKFLNIKSNQCNDNQKNNDNDNTSTTVNDCVDQNRTQDDTDEQPTVKSTVNKNDDDYAENDVDAATGQDNTSSSQQGSSGNSD